MKKNDCKKYHLYCEKLNCNKCADNPKNNGEQPEVISKSVQRRVAVQKPEEEVMKPCPFCNKKPTWVRSYSKWRLSHECNVIRINLSWGKKKDLIKSWNTRQEDK